MSKDMIITIVMTGWAVGGLVIGGAARELYPRDWDAWLPAYIFWPLVLPLVIVGVAGYGVTWLGRGPVVLVRRRRARVRIPRAEVRR